MRKKKSFSLKVTGTKKKVKWSTSDKSLVKLKKNGKTKVKVKAKKKDGACVVRAIVGGKVLYCLVVVNGSTNMSAQSKAWAKAAGFDELLGKTNPKTTPKTTNPSGTPSKTRTETISGGTTPSKPSGSSGTTTPTTPTPPTPPTIPTTPTQPSQPQDSSNVRTAPKYSYSAQVVNMNGIYTRSENSEDLRGVLIKVTTTNPNWDDVVFKVDGNLAAVGFVRFDDVTGNGYAIARTSFSQPGTHTVKVVEGYWANEVQGDYRTVDTNATVTFTVKKFETERANWIDSLITNHRRSTDKETLQAICDWLKANLHYKAYIVDANGNLVRRANLIRHYGSLLHNWDCWGTTELMIDVAKRLNPNLTGSWGTMAGNDPEIDWHRFAVITFPDGTDEAYDACPPTNEHYQIGHINMAM